MLIDINLFSTVLTVLVNDFSHCISLFGDFPYLDYPVPVVFSDAKNVTTYGKQCPDAIAILDPGNNSYSLGPFKAGHHLIVFYTQPVDKDYLKGLVESKVFSNILDMVIISPHPTNEGMFLAHTQNHFKDNDTMLLDVWTEDKGFLLKGKTLFAEDLLNLKGRSLRATGFDFAPFTTSRFGGEFDGIEFLTFKDIAKAMNFKPIIQTPITGIKWDGVVSDILAGVTDFGVSHLFLMYERALTLDYTPAINTDYYCFVVPPGEPYPRWMGLLLPLHWTTWVFTIITCIVCLLFVTAYGKYYKYAEMGPRRLAFYLYGTFVDHSHMETFLFKSHAMKIFILCFLMCFFVLTTGYRGSLISYFTAPYHKDPMNTIREVVDSPLEVKSLGNIVKRTLHLSTDPMMQRLNAKYKNHNSLDEGFKNVSEGKMILLESMQMSQFKIATNYIDSYGNSRVHIARECMTHFPIVFYMPKNNIYTKPLAVILNRLKEAGFTLKRLQDQLGKMNRGGWQNPEAANALSLYELQGAFLIVVTFNAICFFIFLIEIVAKRM